MGTARRTYDLDKEVADGFARWCDEAGYGRAQSRLVTALMWKAQTRMGPMDAAKLIEELNRRTEVGARVGTKPRRQPAGGQE